jgi:hypothetical protein
LEILRGTSVMSYNPYLRMKPTYSNITSPNTTFSAPKIKQPAKPSAPKKSVQQQFKDYVNNSSGLRRAYRKKYGNDDSMMAKWGQRHWERTQNKKPSGIKTKIAKPVM